MAQNKPLGRDTIPRINREAKELFDEAFLMLITFGVDKFTTHVQTKTLKEQQLIFDTFRLFRLCITKAVVEQNS